MLNKLSIQNSTSFAHVIINYIFDPLIDFKIKIKKINIFVTFVVYGVRDSCRHNRGKTCTSTILPSIGIVNDPSKFHPWSMGSQNQCYHWKERNIFYKTACNYVWLVTVWVVTGIGEKNASGFGYRVKNNKIFSHISVFLFIFHYG